MLTVIIWIVGIVLIGGIALSILGIFADLFESGEVDKSSPYHPDNRDKL